MLFSASNSTVSIILLRVLRALHGEIPSGFYFYWMDGDDPWLTMLFQALPHLLLGSTRDDDLERHLNPASHAPASILNRGLYLEPRVGRRLHNRMLCHNQKMCPNALEMMVV